MKETRYIASVSFGKDSLAMLLRLIEEKMPLDEVIFYDTGMEFKAIYSIRDKILPILRANKIRYTELKPKNDFLYLMLEKPVRKKSGLINYGYSWCGGVCRWATTEKIKSIEKHKLGACGYIGIAVDEVERLSKKRIGFNLFPLADWQMTEKDCLKYCYDRGYHWLEDGIDLYSILDRVSCWCCANKNLKELRNYYKYLPEYWQKLKDLQSQTLRPMKKNYSVFDLEKRFKLEDMQRILF